MAGTEAEFDVLAESIELPCGFRIENRLAKSALTEGLADDHNRVTPKHERLYGRWSRGGAGLLVTGNVMIDGRYLERPGNLVIDADAEAKGAMPGFEALARAGRSGGNAFFMQLNHPGRQVNRFVSSEPVAPSASGAVSMFGFFAAPRRLDDAEIEAVIDAFAAAAVRAKRAGFDGVQIHSAHGYLLSQFLSPRVNQRDDRWGGSLEHRARPLMEVIRRTRDAVGREFPVAVKLNSADFQRGGFDESESMRVVEMLDATSIDLLEISGGNYESMALFGLGEGQDVGGPPDDRKESTKRREAYFLDYAEKVRARCRVPLMVTGGFRSPEAMRSALSSGAVDMIGLGRPLIMNPEFPQQILAGQLTPSSAGPVRGLLRSLDGMAEAGWYARQIFRLGDGLEPDPGLGATSSALIYALNDVKRAFAWRRAQRSTAS